MNIRDINIRDFVRNWKVPTLSEGQGAIIGAFTMGAAFFALRLGIGGLKNIMLTAGLTGMEAAAVIQVHTEARRYRARWEGWRARCEGLEHKKQALETAVAEWEGIRDARTAADQEYRRLERIIEIRQRLNFDVSEIAKGAASAAIEGYLAGIDFNRGIFSMGNISRKEFE